MDNATPTVTAQKKGPSAYHERVCATPGCGKVYRSTARHCAPCRAKERECIGCGTIFKSVRLKCPECSKVERECISCGSTFKDKGRVCSACCTVRRDCEECGRSFLGTRRKCRACTRQGLTCIGCGCTFNGSSSLRCGKCRAGVRRCHECGNAFKGRGRKCRSCAQVTRTCIECGILFEGDTSKCVVCATTERDCTSCGKSFRWRGLISICLPCRWRTDPRFRDIGLAARRTRRARKLNATIFGPVSTAVQAAILAAGKCVYCDGPAEELDHVWPLAKGGVHHESNLVPACVPCNRTKSDRWLPNWNPVRVEHGCRQSPKVRAVYELMKSNQLSHI